MQPIAFIFVIVSPKAGFHKCALWCEYDTERDRAYDKVRLSHADVFVYSSIPVYDKNSLLWDCYVRFMRNIDGELISGLRFRNCDPFGVSVELGRSQIPDETERYLSEFTVLVHCESNNKEYVAVLDWMDSNIDLVSGNVKAYFPKGVGMGAIFSGPLPKSMRFDFMGANEGKDFLLIERVKFIRLCVRKAVQKLGLSLMLYNGSGYAEREKLVFDNYDCALIEQCDGLGICRLHE